MVLHNPNNWHWVDKDCIEWAKTYFNKTIPKISHTSPDFKNDSKLELNITKVKTCEGDCGVYQRKGKVISLFDLKMVLTWEGKIINTSEPEKKDKDTSGEESAESEKKEGIVTGEIDIPEIAYDTEKDEYQFNISASSDLSKSEADDVIPHVRKYLVPKLRDALFQFGPDLLKENGQDIQHPINEVKSNFTKSNQSESIAEIHGSNNNSNNKATNAGSTASKSGSASSEKSTSAQSVKPVSVKVAAYNTETVKTETIFRAPASEVYTTLLEKPRVGAWSRSTPIYSPEPSGIPTVGTLYSLFGGNISGKFLQLEKGKLIKQTWRLREWKSDHHATLTWNLIENEHDGETTIKVVFDGIPIGQDEEVLNNFENYYIKPIKITFGYGAVL